jgi:phosphoglycolate phosphatase
MFLLFDFDGVVADSFWAALEVNKLIRPSVSEEEYRQRFSHNINDVSDGYNPDIRFFSEFGPRLMRSSLFPGMKSALELLARNHTLIIISSTITELIRDYLKANGMDGIFKEVLGNEISASKSEKIKMVFGKYQIGPEDCVFITDTAGDIHEARQTGVPAIAVSWGYQDTTALSEEHPMKVVDSAEELVQAIEMLDS